MKLKKTFTIFTFISLFVILFCSFQKNGDDKNEKLTLTAAVYKREIINDVNYLSIKVALRNNSPDTFTYIVMSCYYPFFYKVYPNILIQKGEDCDKNVPELVSIPPYKNIETIISLPIKKNISQLHDTTFEIGIYLTTVNDVVDLLKGKHILGVNPSGVSSKEYDINPLSDTSYKIGVNFMTEKSGMVKRFDTLAVVNFLWSNKIRL